MAKRKTRRDKIKATGGAPKGTSKYARKVRSGRQMYGPGCCGHDKRPTLTRE